MAFTRHGSPEAIEPIKATADTLVCRKCGHVLVRSTGEAKLIISGFGASITCKCGEVVHV